MITKETIQTRFHGEITISASDILVMDQEILGFAKHRQFVLLPHHPESPFLYLQSVTDPQLAFIVIDPLTFKPDYVVPEEEVPGLGNPEFWAILCICTVGQSANGQGLYATANLKSPLIFNRQTRHGGQFVLSLPYPFEYPLFGEAQNNAGAQP
ncbi:flagellar assembly protein FliW [Sulfobacillus thermosulfidooxidans]|uniref:Flagellar assembly factor FliW n=1 Tax=Sulfobacillus thermosulfidooxidans (strain DSM 9293 / VKM B-1269 / AT-1) TaxID=929705 RepID=A0A1W1WF12_SULTA|nr:flagellar assembly protein FliW [Sulfobacillus thermosulfidooxidans]OLZ10243.1 flagellar biosynthesis protein FliW [Sulfobacillus thermosulfidooxidans]OLZ17035.1 flagellar biosynthesis protein FliW [Sulfobacillus thermosulfidooxidans]OLZ20131.1 flagellar biosynthesis protein FliW [Sulfobacillus thermosulfidooxidans]SMC04630.1 flagellar assembly factor FliW [Sulfobacillus thermosulfidooxidans DSM 9293]